MLCLLSCSLGLTSFVNYAQTVDQLLQVDSTEGWLLPKTVTFNKTAGDATQIEQLSLSFFTSNNCSGNTLQTPYTTSNTSPFFLISDNTPFGLVAASTWNVGVNLGIPDMATVCSVAVVLKSSTSDIPQANFTGSACASAIANTSGSFVVCPLLALVVNVYLPLLLLIRILL